MLHDLEIKAAKPRAKPFKLSDGRGLYVRVMPSGAKLFQVRYRSGGKEKIFSLGAWGQSGAGKSLRDARGERDDVLQKVRAGVDPMVEKRVLKARNEVESGNLFEKTSRDWLKNFATRCSPQHAKNVERRLEADVFPALDKLPLAAITPSMVMSLVLEPIQARGATDWVRKARQAIHSIYEYAQHLDRVKAGYNPAQPEITKWLKPKPEVQHQKALLTVDEIRQLILDVESFRAKPITRLANRFLALSALRTSEMRYLTWDMIERTKKGDAFLRIPADVMKMNRAFDIKASRALVEVIDVLETVTGGGQYLFPSDRAPGKPISENGVLFLIQRAGYKDLHTGHGYRASFSTIMNGRHKGMHRVIDAALSHFTGGVEGAYNRAKYIDDRYDLQNEYAALILEGLKPAVSLLEGPRH